MPGVVKTLLTKEPQEPKTIDDHLISPLLFKYYKNPLFGDMEDPANFNHRHIRVQQLHLDYIGIPRVSPAVVTFPSHTFIIHPYVKMSIVL